MQKVEQVEWLSPDELVPYEMNAKTHPAEQVRHIANSIKSFGWTQPIVVDENNVIIIGHGRLMAAKELMLDKVPVVRRDDLPEDQVNALRLADNKTNESPWDFSKLEQELAAMDIAGVDMGKFGFDDLSIPDASSETTEKYTNAVNVPQYEPSGEKPEITDLVKLDKVDELIADIEASDLPESEKKFLKIAAYRHAVIDFDKVADYYAEASEEMQQLMEDSALVIIDLQNAIADGYAELQDVLDDLMERDLDDE